MNIEDVTPEKRNRIKNKILYLIIGILVIGIIVLGVLMIIGKDHNPINFFDEKSLPPQTEEEEIIRQETKHRELEKRGL